MLSFSFRSFAFHPPLPNHKRLHIQVHVDEGPTQRTESFAYAPHKPASISEMLELFVVEPEKVTNFEIEVYEHGEKGAHKYQLIAEETIDINKVLNKASNEITLPTIFGSDAVIGVKLEVSKEILDLTSEESFKTENLDYLDNILTGDVFKLSKLIPILHQAMLAMSPLIEMKDTIIRFITWQDPSMTLVVSLGISVYILYGRILTAFGLLIFSIFGNRMIPYITKVKPITKPKTSKLTIYKTNMKFFKEVVRVFLYAIDYYKNIFESPDKTIAIQILLRLKQLSFFGSMFLFIFPLKWGLLVVYWIALLYNTPAGKKFMLSGYTTFFKFLDTLDYESLRLHKLKDRLFHRNQPPVKVLQNLESYDTTDCTAPSIHDIPPSPRFKVQTKEKVFVVYENQRWWIGKGWRQELLPGERPSWSDELGLIALCKEDVILPTGNWKWESDWKYVMTSKTDDNGWEYASRFKKFENPERKKSFIQSVRRRKWTRRCITYDE